MGGGFGIGFDFTLAVLNWPTLHRIFSPKTIYTDLNLM